MAAEQSAGRGREPGATTVALLVPCYVDLLAPQITLATRRVLERAGCRVRDDFGPGCCGQLHLNSGVRRDAARLARAQLESLAGADVVVSPSASCISTIRRRYTELLPRLREDAQRLCRSSFELGEFLVRELGCPRLGSRFPHRVALLESCHGLRELGLGTRHEGSGECETRVTEQVLRTVDALELLRPRRPEECCGFGGSFSVKLPELSVRIGRSRLRALAETGAEFMTATDLSCLLHLDGLRRREGYGPRPIHLAEILASGLAP
ncbi:MAG: (Fe-S)-binding protein [Myxococcota bacterium]